MKAITYYAAAINPAGKIGQLLVTRENGKSRQEWTGVTYRTQGEAKKDLTRLNCGPR